MVTIKQKLAKNRIVENHGNISKTMLQVGYSKNSAKNPKNLTESDGWKELMEQELPNSLLAQKHKELLNKKEVKRTFNAELGEWIEIETGQIDTQAVSKGLDMAYKLKGNYAPEKKDITTGGERLPSTDLDALATSMAEALKQSKI